MRNNICGADVHKAFVNISIIDEGGREIYRGKYKYKLQGILKLLATIVAMQCTKIAIESTDHL